MSPKFSYEKSTGLFLALLSVSSVVLTLSFHNAAIGNREAGFTLFWLGFALIVVPVVVWLSRKAISENSRVVALLSLGIWAAIPKILRSGGSPAFSDEFAHLSVIRNLSTNGFIDVYNPIVAMAPSYPGFHLLSLSVHSVSGLSYFWVSTVLVLIAHASVPLAIYQLAKQAGLSPRAGSIAALIYISNPSWLFFQAQIAYESLSIPLLLWLLVAISHASKRKNWGIVSAVIIFPTVALTHHLTTIMAIFISIVWVVLLILDRRKGANSDQSSSIVAGITLWGVLFFIAWSYQSLGALIRYYSPSVTGPINEFQAFLEDSSSSVQRAPFSGSQLPIYERVAGLALPLIIFTLIFVGLWKIKKSSEPKTILVRLSIPLSLLYLISMPVLITHTGAEGSHRSWTISYIGLAILFGWMTDQKFELKRPIVSWLNSKVLRRIAVSTVAIVMAVGGVSAGQNEFYRFPGKWIVGDDTRSLTMETQQIADYLGKVSNQNDKIVTDRYISGRTLLQFQGMVIRPSMPYPIWNLMLVNKPMTKEDLGRWKYGRITYLVIDKRMFEEKPAMGYWYATVEPKNSAPVSKQVLQRINCLPWMENVFSTENYRVYKIDPDQITLKNALIVEPALQAGMCRV